MTLTTSAMWVSRVTACGGRCARSPTPPSDTANARCPAVHSSGSTRFQHQAPCQAPWTRTKSAIGWTSDGAGSPQVGDLVGTEAELVEHGLGVGPEQGR